MNNPIATLPTSRRPKAPASATVEAFRQPAYECREHSEALTLTIYVPGVDAAGVEIEGRGADLTVTARKSRFVRVNFTSLHLEPAQRDYLLRLRLGTGFDFAAMHAEFSGGVLTVTLPKRDAGHAAAARLRRAAA
jgi:HSP20 family molecular chaperone IbpA